jgi:hypothetical protein
MDVHVAIRGMHLTEREATIFEVIQVTGRGRIEHVSQLASIFMGPDVE